MEGMQGIGTTRLDDYRLIIEQRPPMRTHGLVYANRAIERLLEEEQALQQVANVACLPGIVGPSMAMPDIHWGYGFPIGGVAAFSTRDGVVSPGGVGYDINCGIRCLRTTLTKAEVVPRLERLLAALFAGIPTGMGKPRVGFALNKKQFEQVLKTGAAWVVRQGLAPADDLEAHEDGGVFQGADPGEVSPRAFERGLPQLGTLGSGNHFIELDFVDRIEDQPAAKSFGLFEGQVLVLVHTGSRGFGHQVCDEYVHRMLAVSQEHGIALPDRQLACAPVQSHAGQAYLGAMACAANFAFANRELITVQIRHIFEQEFGRGFEALGMGLLVDCCHNIARLERVDWQGKSLSVCIHRKGATRSLPPGDRRLPGRYRDTGGPVLVPGDMGRCSYILAGGEKAPESFFSACHGAGRVLSRRQATQRLKGQDVREILKRDAIHALAASPRTLAEEMPQAYKDVTEVVATVSGAGLARRVARLRPLGIIKG